MAIASYLLKLVLAPGLYRIVVVIPVCIFVYTFILGVFREDVFLEVLHRIKLRKK